MHGGGEEHVGDVSGYNAARVRAIHHPMGYFPGPQYMGRLKRGSVETHASNSNDAANKWDGFSSWCRVHGPSIVSPKASRRVQALKKWPTVRGKRFPGIGAEALVSLDRQS